MYAEIAVEAARGLDRETYTYAVPQGMEVVPGHRVWVPFGPRGTYGYVTALHSDDPGLEVKPIERADAEPLLLPHQVALARSVADHYWVPLIECLRAMVPPPDPRRQVLGGRALRQAAPPQPAPGIRPAFGTA